MLPSRCRTYACSSVIRLVSHKSLSSSMRELLQSWHLPLLDMLFGTLYFQDNHKRANTQTPYHLGLFSRKTLYERNTLFSCPYSSLKCLVLQNFTFLINRFRASSTFRVGSINMVVRSSTRTGAKWRWRSLTSANSASDRPQKSLGIEQRVSVCMNNIPELVLALEVRCINHHDSTSL